MKLSATLLAFVVGTISSAVAAQSIDSLPNGWSLHRKIGISPNEVACGPNRAFARSWFGDVSVFDGKTWTKLPSLSDSTQGRAYGTKLAVSRSDEVFVEASGRIAHFDGQNWSLITMPDWQGPIGAMAVLPTGELLVAGRGRIGLREGNVIKSYDAGTWRELNGIAGSNLSDLWTVGQGGTVMRRTRQGWTRLATSTSVWLRGLLVASPTDVWVWQGGPVRNSPGGSVVLRFNGKVFKSTSQGLSGPVIGMAKGQKLWTVGKAYVARFDGTTWKNQLRESDLGAGYHRFVGICTTRQYVVIGDNGYCALTRPVKK